MHLNTDSAAQIIPRLPTLLHVLRERAERHPNRAALSFINDDQQETTITYGELIARVNEVARRILTADHNANTQANASHDSHNVEPGDRAILLFPAGLDFIVGLFACHAARVVPVPACYPKPGRAMPQLDAAISDCSPDLILSDSQTIDSMAFHRLSPVISNMRMVATDVSLDERLPTSDDIRELPENVSQAFAEIETDDLALLQYTSGSTNAPKGVMVSHANLMANLETIRNAFGLNYGEADKDDYTRAVFWLPHYHDMGLIGGILDTIYIGGHTTLMSPRSFLSKPLRWLRTIAERNATVSGAPNFAYELCIDRITPDEASAVDLSQWSVAFCGAEPVAADTLDRFSQRFELSGFRRAAFLPCYGLAEATLLVSCSDQGVPFRQLLVDRDALLTGRVSPVAESHPRNLTRNIVSCGVVRGDTQIEIVDPVSRSRRNEGEIGEIWLTGSSIARGYWCREEVNRQQFRATLDCDNGTDGQDNAGQTFLRTGDLGFIHEGELYVTGRCKDIIVLRGRNYYPHDIESTIERALGDSALRCAAVATDAFVGDAMSIVIEVDRHLSDASLPELVRCARRAIIEEHEVDARQVLLTKPGTIPVTTSGKLKRAECRLRLQADEIEHRYQWMRSIISDDSVATQLPPLPRFVNSHTLTHATEQIETWLTQWLVARCGALPGDVSPDTPFADHGLDSMTAVELSSELDDWLGVELTPELAANYPTPTELAGYLAEQMRGAAANADSGLVEN